MQLAPNKSPFYAKLSKYSRDGMMLPRLRRMIQEQLSLEQIASIFVDLKQYRFSDEDERTLLDVFAPGPVMAPICRSIPSQSFTHEFSIQSFTITVREGDGVGSKELTYPLPLSEVLSFRKHNYEPSPHTTDYWLQQADHEASLQARDCGGSLDRLEGYCALMLLVRRALVATSTLDKASLSFFCKAYHSALVDRHIRKDKPKGVDLIELLFDATNIACEALRRTM